MDRLSSDQKLHAMRLIAEGNYQTAIKFLIDMTAASLNMPVPNKAEWHLWDGGFKIDAIKAYRNRFPGSDLKHTKDLFEQEPSRL